MDSERRLLRFVRIPCHNCPREHLVIRPGGTAELPVDALVCACGAAMGLAWDETGVMVNHVPVEDSKLASEAYWEDYLN